jgi:hypothetical protein
MFVQKEALWISCLQILQVSSPEKASWQVTKSGPDLYLWPSADQIFVFEFSVTFWYKLTFMKKITSFFLILSVFFFSLARAQSQDDMKAMMAYSTPGEVHQMMAKSTGTWNGAVTMWMQPGAPPMSMNAVAKNEMILGGRYLQATNSGQMMGMPFEGISVTGYDNAKKIFVNSWIDNFGTGMLYLEGTWDNSTMSINLSGKMVDPSSGKDIPIREVIKFVDDNTQLMDMYVNANGSEYKSMEIKYTRK